MAKKFAITQATAMNMVKAIICNHENTEVVCENNEVSVEEFYEVINHMTEMKHRTSTKVPTESKAHKENAKLFEQVRQAFEPNSRFTAKDITYKVTFVTTTQKAIAVMKQAIDEGLAKREQVKGKTLYYYE